METVTDFIFFGSKITADGDCCHEVKRHLLLGRKVIKKQRHHFADKGPYNQHYGFSVVMYTYEGWTIKKAEYQRIDVFELWCWKRLLRKSLGLQGDPTSPS